MPRFAPEKWKPGDDSSTGYATLDPECVVLNVSVSKDPRTKRPVSCPCGCGEFPLGDKATFCMGHDARLRGVLIRAHLMGASIRHHTDGVLSDPVAAITLAETHHWKSYLDSATVKREGKNREVLRRALGSPDLIRVGRWQYTGQVAAVYRLNGKGLVEIEYVNQAGDAKKIRVPEDAPEAQEATPA